MTIPILDYIAKRSIVLFWEASRATGLSYGALNIMCYVIVLPVIALFLVILNISTITSEKLKLLVMYLLSLNIVLCIALFMKLQ